MQRSTDPPRMPGTGWAPSELLARASPIAGTPGQTYIERRGISVDVAASAGVRFDADFGGRPAVIVGLRNRQDTLVAVHGRYLQTVHRQTKMLTIGSGGGVIDVLGGWRVEPLILVEGLFDSLSLAVRGVASVATIGRWAPWLPEVSAGRVVWLAFDATKSGDQEAAIYRGRLIDATVRRLLPPPRCKDWSTALAKRGPASVGWWIRASLAASGQAPQ